MIKDCLNCSECCENIILPLAVVLNEDQKRWVELHEGLKVLHNNVININNKCSKLVDGRCSIYEDRPNNCKEFICYK